MRKWETGESECKLLRPCRLEGGEHKSHVKIFCQFTLVGGREGKGVFLYLDYPALHLLISWPTNLHGVKKTKQKIFKTALPVVPGMTIL